MLEITGTFGNITLYRVGDQILAKRKNQVPAGKIAQDPKFQSLRDHQAEFGAATRAAKAIRNALAPVLRGADRLSSGRLNGVCCSCVKSDPIHSRGSRTMADGDHRLLEGFSFNEGAPLDAAFKGSWTVDADRTTGICSMIIAPFPKRAVHAAPGATHFRFVLAASAHDFAGGKSTHCCVESPLLRCPSASADEIRLSAQLPGMEDHPVLIAVAVQYFVVTDGRRELLRDGAANAIELVRVVR